MLSTLQKGEHVRVTGVPLLGAISLSRRKKGIAVTWDPDECAVEPPILKWVVTDVLMFAGHVADTNAVRVEALYPAKHIHLLLPFCQLGSDAMKLVSEVAQVLFSQAVRLSRAAQGALARAVKLKR